MKMSNFENPTWRTAAILKIIISPYLGRKSSEFHEIFSMQTQIYRRQRKRQNIRNSQIQMADGRHIENHFLAITQLHAVPLR